MPKDQRFFLNPYQFIPLDGTKKSEGTKETKEQLFTGKLTYTLETKTPLFIPNTSNDHVFKPENGQVTEHQSFDFFSYRDLSGREGEYYDEPEKMSEPIIPGSEIRGMVRNIYETLTGSCLSAIQKKDEFPSKRTMEYGKPGLIRFNKAGELYLYEANSYAWYDGKPGEYELFYKTCLLPEGCKVLFSVNKSGRLRAENVEEWNSTDKKKSTGYLIKGNHGIKLGFSGSVKEKYNCHIFAVKSNSKGRKILEEDKKRFIEVLDSYAVQSQDKQEEKPYVDYTEKAHRFLEQSSENEYFPVYYSFIGEPIDPSHIYLSPACVSRESYLNTIHKITEKWTPCNGEKEICPACELFGLIGEKNENSRASKLRFSDAALVTVPDRLDELYIKGTIPALGQPKLSNTEFYLKWQPNASLLTYDYYIEDGKLLIEAMPEIAGRKYYWHQNIKKLPKAQERTKLNRTIRAVKPEKEFCGTVYFEDITEKQLKQLIWILNLSENAEKEAPGKELGFKLGMGKPLGLGSVALRLKEEECCLRSWVVEKNEILLNLSGKPCNGNYCVSYEDAGFLPNTKAPFLLLCDLHAAEGLTVSYPYTAADTQEEEEKGYQWYEKNHKKGRTAPRERFAMVTKEHLKGFGELESKKVCSAEDFLLPTEPGRSVIPEESVKQDQKQKQKQNQKRNFSSSRNSKNAFVPENKCIWKANKKLTSRQEQSLKNLMGLMKMPEIKKETGELTLEEIEKYSKVYGTIALPADTGKTLVNEAKQKFKKVYIAVKDKKGNENGWK